jgi:hypothetical protein
MTKEEYETRCNFLNDMMEDARKSKPFNMLMYRSVMGYAHEERDKAYLEYKGSLINE